MELAGPNNLYRKGTSGHERLSLKTAQKNQRSGVWGKINRDQLTKLIPWNQRQVLKAPRSRIDPWCALLSSRQKIKIKCPKEHRATSKIPRDKLTADWKCYERNRGKTKKVKNPRSRKAEEKEKMKLRKEIEQIFSEEEQKEVNHSTLRDCLHAPHFSPPSKISSIRPQMGDVEIASEEKALWPSNRKQSKKWKQTQIPIKKINWMSLTLRSSCIYSQTDCTLELKKNLNI